MSGTLVVDSSLLAQAAPLNMAAAADAGASVPEPATMAMLAMGIPAILGRRRGWAGWR